MDPFDPRASQPSRLSRPQISFICFLLSWLHGRQHRIGQLARHLALRSGMALGLLVILLSGVLGTFAQAGIGAAPVASAHATIAWQGTPNRVSPATSPVLKKKAPPAGFGLGKTANAKAGPPQSLRRSAALLPMKPADLPLSSATTATTFLSSDKRLEVDVPAGAISASDLAAASGTGGLQLKISQIAPASGSSAGGSGLVSFGTYLIQLVNDQGILQTHGLRQPVTLKLHYGTADGALNLQHSFVIFNGSLPYGTALALLGPPIEPVPATVNGHAVPHGVTQASSESQSASAPPPTQANSHFGARSRQSATLDTANQTLTLQADLSSASSSLSFDTDSSVSTFGKPDIFNTSLNAGALTASYPLNLPSGPGGFTPPLNLTYSSESVAEQHNPQGASGWVGEGWNLDLGSITWAEHNVTESCQSTCGNNWEDTWELNDPYGTATQLIPWNINISTYYDDTGNPIDNGAVRWHTSEESTDWIQSFTSGLTLPDGGGVNPPCFRVFLPNDIMEEFGCTADSLEYYYSPTTGHDYISSWNLDMITDPQGNQIHVTYQQDQETMSVDGVNHPYIRDAQISTITWDSPTCLNEYTACTTTGTAPNLWQPLLQVSFSASHTPTRLTSAPTSGCNTGTNLRCDDPLDLSGSGGDAAPEVQSDFVLNDLDVQVNNSGIWHTLNDYQFQYTQTVPTTITDPSTGYPESTAGELALTQIQDVGADGSTSLPPSTYTYQPQTEYYEDDVYFPSPSTNCGGTIMPWNTGTGSGCILWNASYAGNSYYLSTADNGQGLYQIFTWENARNNTHGVNGGGTNTADANYCNTLNPTAQATYPCNEADDENWSHIVLAEEDDEVYNASSGDNSLVQQATSYAYDLSYPLVAQECSDCVAGMYWGNQNDGDYLDYYNAQFMGFAQTDVSNADGSVEHHLYLSTLGYGIYDTTQVNCYAYHPPCNDDPWWDVGNAGHGHEIETDYYAPNGTTLLKKVTTQYTAICPPLPAYLATGQLTPPSSVWGNWDGQLVSELDHNNPVSVCFMQAAQSDEYDYNGATGTVPEETTTSTYDAYNQPTHVVMDANGGGEAMGSPPSIAINYQYSLNLPVYLYGNSAEGPNFVDMLQGIQVGPNTEIGGQNVSCSYTGYDGSGPDIGSDTKLTLGEPTETLTFTGCDYAPKIGQLETTRTYDAYGNPITSDDADANAGNTNHVGCTVNSKQYSTCTSYDPTFEALPTSTTNALNQTSLTTYSSAPSATNGYGLWPISTTDVNNQTTSYTYDALGRLTGEMLPGETAGDTTASWTYTDFCPTTGPSTPCVEIDQTQRLNSSTTVTSRAFYDGYGNLVETRSSGPAGSGEDVVTYHVYDDMERDAFDSISYFVPAYTGAPGAAAFSVPNSTEPKTATTYDGLGRVLTSEDALSNTSTTQYGVECGLSNPTDTACYSSTITIDPNGHDTLELTDALGRVRLTQTYTGNGTSQNPYTPYATTQYGYDGLGDLITIEEPDNVHDVTATYNSQGQETSISDPDLGSFTYTYDADGNVTESVDARGSSGTTYAGYDGLDRQLWRNTTNTPTGAYVTYSYDSTTGGNSGVGRLTGETFNQGSTFGVGSYTYTYDARGQQTAWTTTLDGTSYPFSATYDDAGQTTSLSYSDGTALTDNYDTNGWLNSAVTGSTNLYTALSYTDPGGATGLPNTAKLSNGAMSYTAQYDADLRPTSTTLSVGSKVKYQSQTGYDAVGNVIAESTTLKAGTDNQAFCYDELNRLTWAGSSGAPPCGESLTEGTLTSAAYSQSYTYDNLNRLASGPAGSSYTYGGTQLDAATSTSGGYTASYDATGDMVCRATTSSTTCSGTQTGQPMTYDNERRLTQWQNKPTKPTKTVEYRYDGEGNRVAMQVTSGTTITTTYYPFPTEEKTGSTLTKYFGAAGLPVAVEVGSTISYLTSNSIGSVTEAFSSSGSITAQKLYTPYGSVRYTSGTMPTSYGFTGQLGDSTTGLDYYNARYYDPTLGQFTSADSALDGLNRYSYVGDNPETFVDPTGHVLGQGEEGGDEFAAFNPGFDGDISGPGVPGFADSGDFVQVATTQSPALDIDGFDYTNAQVSFQENPAGDIRETITQDGTTVYVNEVTPGDNDYLSVEEAADAASPLNGEGDYANGERAEQLNTTHTEEDNEIQDQENAQNTTTNSNNTQTTSETDENSGGKQKTVVIGQDIGRTKNYAEINGAQAYRPWTEAVNDLLSRNTRWIQTAMNNGYQIVDIGLDEDVVRPPSEFYQMELDQTRGYWNLTHEYWPGSQNLPPVP